MGLLGRVFGSNTPAGGPAAGRPSGLVSPGSAGTLLSVFLSAMPAATQVQQKTRFAAVQASFEFGLFVRLDAAERLAEEAMARGFTVWGNLDATSAFLYGAGVVGEDQFTPVMNWLREAATPGQKIQAALHGAGQPMRLIAVAV